MREIDERFEKLKPVLGEKTDSLWLTYQLEDYEGRKDVADIVNALTAKLGETYSKNKILLEPPILDGDYPLGAVLYGDKPYSTFYVKEKRLPEHIAVFGRSGAGKTNVGYLILENLLKNNKPFLVFDFKRDFRDLSSLPNFDEIVYFTLGRDVVPFYFNPLIPPSNTSPTVWVKKVVEVFCHAFFEGHGVFYLMLNAIDSLYKQFGVYDGSGVYPTLKDVYNFLEGYPARSREVLWKASALRGLATLCYGEIGRTVNVRNQVPFNYFLDKNVVFELDALSEDDRTFFIEAILLWIHQYRLQQSEKGKLKHVIVIEESQGVLNRKKEEREGRETTTERCLRELRELGEAVIYMAQNPSLISKTALGNTFCSISLSLAHRADINLASDCLLLEDKEYLSQLKSGEGIVKLQDYWTKPFLVKFPLFKIKKGIVGDEQLKKKMTGLLTELDKFRVEQAERTENLQFRSKEKEGVKSEEELLLEDIVANEVSGISERKNRLGVSAYKIKKLKDGLLQKELVDEVPVNKGNSRIKLLALTDRGKRVMKGKGFNVDTSWRKGGVEHLFWKEEVASLLRAQGFSVSLELPIGDGKTVDVVAERDGRRIAVEVETGKSDIIGNIEKVLGAGFDSVFSVVTDKVAENKARRRAESLGLGVRVLSPNEFSNLVKRGV